MKTFLLAVIFLAVGVGVGIWSSSRDFIGEVLPTKASLEYLAQQRSAPKEQSGPRLVVPGGETHDFGILALWAKQQHTFLLRNEGNEKLRLVMGKPTCSCTAGSSGGEPLKEGDVLEIEPGQERPLTMEWEIKSSQENFSQSAPFQTNDPNRSSLTLAIVGRVQDAIRPSREVVVFSNVPVSEPSTQSIRLDTLQNNNLTITGHRWLQSDNAGFFDCKVEALPAEEAAQISPGASSLLVFITVKPGLPLGRFTQTLELTTNMAPAVPPMKVSIEGTIVGDILVLGPGVDNAAQTLGLGVVPQGKGTKRTFHVVVKGPHRDETEVSVSSVEPANLRVALGEPDRSNPNVRLHPVTVEIPADAQPVNLSGSEGGRTGHIVLKTTHPQIKQLELKVVYIVRE